MRNVCSYFLCFIKECNICLIHFQVCIGSSFATTDVGERAYYQAHRGARASYQVII